MHASLFLFGRFVNHSRNEIDTAPVDVETDAQQLTQNPATDSDLVGAPTEENASREA
jgi:hypothetical protein